MEKSLVVLLTALTALAVGAYAVSKTGQPDRLPSPSAGPQAREAAMPREGTATAIFGLG